MSDWATPGANLALAGTAVPTTFHVRRHTGDPGTDGTANVASDTRRIAIDMGTPAGGIVLNDTYGEILNATHTEDITHVSYWDHTSAGNCWFIDELGATLNILATETVAIAIGQASINLNVWS